MGVRGGHAGHRAVKQTPRTHEKSNRLCGRLVGEWVAVVIVALTLTLACLAAIQVTDADEIDTSQVIVQPGDNLWSLAVENPVPELSVAETCNLIKRINGMETSSLNAGEVIDVPIAQESGWTVVSR